MNGVKYNILSRSNLWDSKHFTIIDAPGHRDFIKNMISGASQADVALLMVPAETGGFEKAIAKGDHKKNEVQGQTRQHARLCKLLGIEQIIVGINKMDDPSVNYSQARFDEIKKEVSDMLSKIGYKMNRIPVIPISGFKGENLTEKSDNMPWYSGFEVAVSKTEKVSGHTIVDALEKVVRIPPRPKDVPFRMPVSGVYKITGIGDVITGRVEQGVLKPNTEVTFLPTGVTGKVFTIEMHHRKHEQALAGDNVGLNVKGLPKDNLPRVGDVMVINKDPYQKIPALPTKTFRAVVMVQEHPGQLKAATEEGKGGFTPSVHIRTGKAPCQMTKIHWKRGKKSTGGNKVEDPLFVESNDEAEITFTVKGNLFADTFDTCKGLGRVAIMDSNSLKMLGKILEVETRPLK